MDVCVSCALFWKAPEIQAFFCPDCESVREFCNQAIDFKDFLFIAIEDEV